MSEDNQPAVKIFLAVLTIKLLLAGGVYYFLGEERFIWSDSATYLELGRRIFAGESFGDPLRTPLYPFILGAFFALTSHGALWGAVVQAFFAAGAAFFVFKIGKRFLSSRGASIAALAISFEPLISALNLVLFPETILIFFLAAAAHFFLSYLERRSPAPFLYAAIFTALAAWTKPVAAYLLLPLSLVFLLQREFIRGIAFATLVALLISPWMFYNLRVYGMFSMTAQGENNFCGYALMSVLAAEYHKDPSDMAESAFPPDLQEAKAHCRGPADAFRIFLSEYPRAFFKTIFLSSLSFLTNDGYGAFLTGENVSEVKAHHNYLTPAVFAASDWKEKMAAAWAELGYAERAAVLAGRIVWSLTALLASIGMWIAVTRKESRMAALTLILLFLYFFSITVASTGFGVGARLRYPVSWVMIIFATLPIERIIYFWRSRRV